MTLPEITVFTSDRLPLCKRFTLQGDEIQKTTLATLYEGSAVTAPAGTAAALQSILQGLDHRQAVAIGQLKTGRASRISTAAKRKTGAVTRSLANFDFAPGAGWLLWDYDDKTMPPQVAAKVAELGGPVAAFFELWPEAKDAAHVIRPSSSDGITAPGRAPLESAGLHGFFLVQDVSQSKAILEALENRAWALGLAWIALSKSGAQLRRSIVDVAVGSPERLIFEAPPILDGPVTKLDRPAIVNEGYALATPALPLELAAIANAKQADARDTITPKALEVENAYLDSRAKADAKKTGRTIAEARANIQRMMKGATLADDHLLQMKEGRWVAVGDVLDAPERYDRTSLPDPIEGIEYGTDKATLLIKPRAGFPGDKPRLVSHAHGQTVVYRFARFETPTQPPFHPAPKGDRAANIAAHDRTVRAFIADNCAPIRASKAVKALYALIDPLDPDRHALQRKAQGEVRDMLQLDYTPTTKPKIRTERRRWLLSGAQGVGKSAAMVGRTDKDTDKITTGELHNTAGIVSLVLAPDNTKADELADEYAKNAPTGAPPVFRLRGRSAISPKTGQSLCRTPKAAEKMAKKGGNVRGGLCKICPHANECEYLTREAKLKAILAQDAGGVIVGPQEYGFLPLPNGLTPDLVVFDEALRGLGAETASLTFDDLAEPLQAEDTGRAKSALGKVEEGADAAAANLQFLKPLRVALVQGFKDSPADPYARLRERGLGVDTVKGALEALHLFQEKELESAVAAAVASWEMAGGQGPGLETRLESVIDSKESKKNKAFQAICEALLKDLEKDAPAPIGLTCKGETITAHNLTKPYFSDDTPMLHLDGTATLELAEAVFGAFVHHHYPVERNAHVTQVLGHGFSNKGITGKGLNGGTDPGAEGRAKEVRRGIIEQVARFPGKTVTIGSKRVIESLLADGLTGDVGHFGAIRGRNDWENADAVFIVGREQPGSEKIEEKARAFAASDMTGKTFASLRGCANTNVIGPNHTDPDKFGSYLATPRALRMAKGQPPQSVEVNHHPDPWAELVLRQIRDAEIMQAIDRARLIHNKEPKRVFILAPVALDITVDEVAEWRDFKNGGSRIEQARERGVLPLSKSGARALFPDIWKSDGAAQRDVEKIADAAKSLSDQMVSNIYYLRNGPLRATLAEYQLAPVSGKRMRKQSALIYAPPGEARAKLETLTGPLQSFAIVEGWEEAADAIEAAIYEREERAAKYEYDAGLTREEAERAADRGPEYIPPAAPEPYPDPVPQPRPAPVAVPLGADPPPLRIATGGSP